MSDELLDQRTGGGVTDTVVPPQSSNRVLRWWRGFGRAPRIMGVDIARALAVIGMIGAHVGLAGDLVWTDPSTWSGIVHGRSSVLFAVLAGVSVSVVTGRSTPLPAEQIPAARLRLVGRGAAVLLIGLVLELLNTSIAIILGVYGLLFVFATAFLHWGARRLFVVGAALALLGPPALAFVHALTLDAWGPALDFLVFGTYPITAWIAYLLIGMGVGRLRIDTRKVAAVLLGAGVILAFVAYDVGSFVNDDDDWEEKSSWEDSSWEDGGYVTKPGTEVDLGGMVCDVEPGVWVSCYPEGETWVDVDDDSWDEEPWTEDDYSYAEQFEWQMALESVRASITNDYPHSGGVLDIVGTTGVALAALGACLLLAAPLRWVLLPVAALGSMPLTAYAVHVISVVVMGGGPGGMVANSNGVWLWSCVTIGLAAMLWSQLFGKGPLERLVARAGAAMVRPPRRGL